MHDTGLFKQNLSAIFAVIFGFAAFSCSDTALKWLSSGYTIPQIIWTVNLIGLALTSVWILLQYGPKGFYSPRWKWHLIRGFSIVGSAYCVVQSFSRIPLADFYGTIFVSPILVMLISHFFLGEKVGWHRFAAAIAGFGGVFIIAGPQYEEFGTGILFALAAAVFASINAIVTRKARPEPKLQQFALYPFLLNALIYIPFALPDFVMPAAHDIPIFLIVPPFILVGFIFYSIGFSRSSEIAIVAPFHYTQIIWGALFGYALFGDIPSLATFAGASLIIASGLYIIWREHKTHQSHMVR